MNCQIPARITERARSLCNRVSCAINHRVGNEDLSRQTSQPTEGRSMVEPEATRLSLRISGDCGYILYILASSKIELKNQSLSIIRDCN
jgi:hypothetical protein